MKILKFILRIAYIPTLAFGTACLVTGFISVGKALMNINTISSFEELMNINSSVFDAFIQPLTIIFIIAYIALILILKLVGKEHLIRKNMLF